MAFQWTEPTNLKLNLPDTSIWGLAHIISVGWLFACPDLRTYERSKSQEDCSPDKKRWPCVLCNKEGIFIKRYMHSSKFRWYCDIMTMPLLVEGGELWHIFKSPLSKMLRLEFWYLWIKNFMYLENSVLWFLTLWTMRETEKHFRTSNEHSCAPLRLPHFSYFPHI
jgi:hypothetical protein